MEILSELLPTTSRKQTCLKKSGRSKKSPYHSNAVVENEKNYSKMIDRNMDPTKYAIPSYYVPQDDEVDNDMGMWADKTVNKPDSFEKQFDLQGQKKNVIRAANDMDEGISDLNCLNAKWATFNSDGDDMTLGVIDKNSEEFRNTNMGHDARMRDFANPDFTDNRVLEMFTGENSIKPVKKEQKPLFASSVDVFHDDGANLIKEEEMRYRELIGDKKNGVSLTKPRQIAPRLDLDEKQDTIRAGPDLTRVMPLTIDQMRGENKLQRSYTTPMIGGKKGEKRALIGATEVRKANLVEENRPIYADGGIKLPKQYDKIKVRDTDKTTEGHVIGVASCRPKAYNPKTEGKIHQKTKTTYTGHMGIASARDKRASIDPKSIELYDNQRTHTTYEQSGNITGKNRGVRVSKDMRVKSKQILPEENHTMVSKSKGGHAYNRNDRIKGKQLLQNEQHGNIRGSHSGAYYTDAPRTTMKQTTVGMERSSFMAPQEKQTYAPMQDEVRGTLKQTTVGIQQSSFMTPQQKQSYTPMQDDVKRTMKQTTVGMQQSSFLNPEQRNIRTTMQDDVRKTIKQSTTGIERASFMAPRQKMNKTGMQDKVRKTHREGIIQYQYDGPISKHENTGYQRNNMYAPVNKRNLCNVENYSYAVQSSGNNQHNPALTNKYHAPQTIKQTTMHSRMGGANDPYAMTDQAQFYNAYYNDVKEGTLLGRAPMGSGPTQFPDARNIGEVRIPGDDMQSYDRNGNLQINNHFNPKYEMEANVEPMYGDRIGMYDTRDPNSHIQRQYYRGPPSYSQNPIHESEQQCYSCYEDNVRLSDINERGHNMNSQSYNEMYNEPQYEGEDFEFSEDEYVEETDDEGDGADYYSSAI